MMSGAVVKMTVRIEICHKFLFNEDDKYGNSLSPKFIFLNNIYIINV